LVPRRPLAAFEPVETKKRPNQAAAAKKRLEEANAGEPSPAPPEDMDERLIFDAHRLANQYVSEMVCFPFSILILSNVSYFFDSSLLVNRLVLI